MNSKWHLYTSLVKSAIRIIGCIFGLAGNMWVFILLILLAEVLGIVEEMGDKR